MCPSMRVQSSLSQSQLSRSIVQPVRTSTYGTFLPQQRIQTGTGMYTSSAGMTATGYGSVGGYGLGGNSSGQYASSQNIDMASSVGGNAVAAYYRGLGMPTEERLAMIAKAFMDKYSDNGIIQESHVNRIQMEANERKAGQQIPTKEGVQQLGKILDYNRDGVVTKEDIVSLTRRYLNCEKRPIIYTSTVQQRLAVARRLFNQFDVDKKGYLTEKQVPNLLSETYKSLGKSFQATEDDVKSWMKLTDIDNNGRVTLPEYENSIIRALNKLGIKIY